MAKTLKYKRRRLSWFVNRVGKAIICNNMNDLFNPCIIIMSEGHARALFITQVEKGYFYELLTNKTKT